MSTQMILICSHEGWLFTDYLIPGKQRTTEYVTVIISVRDNDFHANFFCSV